MSKPFIALLFGGIFYIIGLMTAAYFTQPEINRLRQELDLRTIETIVLQVPKNDTELSKQIIYQEAELAMLKEIYRQKKETDGHRRLHTKNGYTIIKK